MSEIGNPLISVITLTRNKCAVTRRCLPTLLHSDYAPWELIVVDNGSNDNTHHWFHDLKSEAAARDVPVTVILNPPDTGCSTARNQGIEAARGELIVFTDNDVALRSRAWLTRMARCLADEPDVAMVGPKLVYPSPPHDIQCAGAAISPTGRPQFMGRGEPRDDPRFNTARDVQCLISACIMVRHAILDELGGFDEAFNPVQFEDFDLCYRFREQGHRIVYLPDIEMYHLESTTTAGTPSLPNTRVIVQNGLKFKRRWNHMFKTENGPPDPETKWKQIEGVRIEQIEACPLI